MDNHFGVTPTQICTAILNALGTLLIDGQQGTGCVRTVRRLRDDTKEALKAAMTAGAPAILLFYEGGVSDQVDTTGLREEDLLTFKILCVSGALTNIADRQDKGQRDPDLAVRPGVEELQDWSRYLALRAMSSLNVTRPRTTRFTQAFQITPEHFVAAVLLTCSRWVDIYDDATANSLQSLGIVHDPTNGYDPETDEWFESDNETPISDWPPPGVDGGVADL
jgi:hypothetical protein